MSEASSVSQEEYIRSMTFGTVKKIQRETTRKTQRTGNKITTPKYKSKGEKELALMA